MADLRSYHLGVAIADNLATPSNDTLGAASFLMNYDGANWDMVRGDATDGLLVNLGSNNDVSISGTPTVDTELPAAAALTDDFANPTAPGVGAFLMLWDSATWDRAPGTSADGLLVNLGSNNDVTVTGSVTVDTELTAVAAMADDTANPTITTIASYLMGYDNGNTNWNRVRVDDAGHLQVDVLSGGGTDTPTNPVNEYETSASVAAGATGTLTTAEAGGKSLAALECWASVAYKVTLFTVLDGVESTDPLVIGGGQAHQAWSWKPTHRSYVPLAANAGLDAFRVKIDNLDDTNAADVYATFHYEDS
jgi:hypothetical protein